MVNIQFLLEFMKFHLFHIDEGRLYGCLLPDALKFLGILASSGPTLAYNLIHRYGLNQRLQNHLVVIVKYEISVKKLIFIQIKLLVNHHLSTTIPHLLNYYLYGEF